MFKFFSSSVTFMKLAFLFKWYLITIRFHILNQTIHELIHLLTKYLLNARLRTRYWGFCGESDFFLSFFFFFFLYFKGSMARGADRHITCNKMLWWNQKSMGFWRIKLKQIWNLAFTSETFQPLYISGISSVKWNDIFFF